MLSTIDEEHLRVIRDSIRSFLTECARQFDGPGQLLDIAPPAGQGAAAYFSKAQVSTLDADPAFHATDPAGSFDWIVCTEALAHLPDPFAAVAEIRRLLKQGGHAFVTVPLNVGIDRRPADFWRFTEHGLRALLQDFTILSLEQTPTPGRAGMPLHYRAIARKDHPGVPEFSVLITCYFEERSIEEFHARLSEAMRALGRSYEIIFVNDGSTDRTFEKLSGIFDRDPSVSAILDMFRNAGQLAAITAALCESRGRALLLMDSDLQLAPEEIPLLVAEYDKGFDVVSGARVNRKDSWLRISSLQARQCHYAKSHPERVPRFRMHLQDLQCPARASIRLWPASPFQHCRYDRARRPPLRSASHSLPA